jgi:Mn2+/Fe2+ NRAMP family transporter
MAVTTTSDINKMRVDVWSGMFLSNLVMFFIIAVCAVTLHEHGIVNITSATDAAVALKPLGGNLAYLLFTAGIIGTGMLGIPVLAGSSSYAISESFGWREGLYRRFKQAHAFYGVIILSMIIGLLMNFLHLHLIKMLIYSALINGIIAPFILAIIVLLSSNKKIMKEWTNHPAVTVVGWVITIFMACASVSTIWFLFRT